VAMTREDAAGQPFGGWLPEQRLTREMAIAGFLGGAAYAGRAEDRLGGLAPGMRADFLLVDRDITLASPSDIRRVVVNETWVNGRMVYRRAENAADTGRRN
jgi:predicted amidohydrolase YtcJ